MFLGRGAHVRRQRDRRDPGGVTGQRTDLTQERKAVHRRKPDVADHHVGCRRGQKGKRIRRRSRRAHHRAALPEDEGHHIEQVRVVVDAQNLPPLE
jgi:hypothetical protein